jgi:hypothetical protein
MAAGVDRMKNIQSMNHQKEFSCPAHQNPASVQNRSFHRFCFQLFDSYSKKKSCASRTHSTICHDPCNLVRNVLDKKFHFSSSDGRDSFGQSCHLAFADSGSFVHQKAVHLIIIKEETACAERSDIFSVCKNRHDKLEHTGITFFNDGLL